MTKDQFYDYLQRNFPNDFHRGPNGEMTWLKDPNLLPPAQLPNTLDAPPVPANTLHGNLDAAAERTGQSPSIPSPIVLDLNGNGIEVTKLGYGAGASHVHFDMNNDGFAERTAWVTGGDGLLVWDRNGNGRIDNQSELFGNSSTLPDGFAALRLLDTNHDGKITSADANFGKLKVWIDANGNGVTDAGELKSLASLSITSINLNAVAQSNVYLNENQVSAVSTFTRSDGTTGAASHGKNLSAI
jgi:hypothetical protein